MGPDAEYLANLLILCAKHQCEQKKRDTTAGPAGVAYLPLFRLNIGPNRTSPKPSTFYIERWHGSAPFPDLSGGPALCYPVSEISAS